MGVTIQKSRPTPINQVEDIARIRTKYYALLQDGFTPVDAAAIAEGRKPMPKTLPKKKTRAPDFAADQEPASETTFKIPSKKDGSPDIPPGWEDLSWPKLQKLAASLDKVKLDEVKSRSQANQIVLSHIVGASGDDEDAE